ncbi:hypothetical protein [Klebsiella pneumoniae]
MYLQDLDNSTKLYGKTGAGFTANRTLQNGWFEGFIISKSGHKYVFCVRTYRKLGVEFNIKHKSQEKCDHHSKHTKFIKNLMAKSPNPSIKSGRPKASFWLPSLALGAPYFKR